MTDKEETKTGNKRKLVVPGEVVAKGDDFLPGEWTRKEGDEIIASKYGLLEISGRLVKIIPVSGVYTPRRGNVVIGVVTDVTFSGWPTDIGAPYASFLSVAECPKYINREDLADHYNVGEIIVAKVKSAKRNGIDLTLKSRGLGKLNDGMIVKINPNKVPRVIGKEGSMINLIKDNTKCEITVGQNGLVWLKADTVEQQLKAKEVIEFISERSATEGLTEQVEKYLKEQGGKK